MNRGRVTAVALSLMLLCAEGAQAEPPAKNIFGPTAQTVPLPDVVPPEIAATQELNAAEERKRRRPVTDDQGRIHYIVMLADDATALYEAMSPATLDALTSSSPGNDRLGSWHKPAMRYLNTQIEQQFGHSATGLYSWVYNGFSAFLTPDQVAGLRKDPRVKSIEQNRYVQSSGLWSDVAGAQIKPWGIQAVGGPRASNSSAVVYVVDAGVGRHQDLNLQGSVSASLGVPTVGCYTHATMVAGIIGAANNGAGVVGVDASVPITSSGVITGVNASKNCAVGAEGNGFGDNYAPTIDTIVSALDGIRSIPTSRVSVINLSLNASDMPASSAFRTAVIRATTPSGSYKGALVVQSAGNDFADACGWAYVPTSGASLPSDGVMIVGAVDNNGQPVMPLNGKNAFRKRSLAANWEVGSNYGKCVDIWAPGNNIQSTGGGTSYDSNDQSGDTTYSNVFFGSGTSFAAPHVAGVAAYLIENNATLTTPALVESAVRSYVAPLGSRDTSGYAVSMPNLSGIHPTAIPTVEWWLLANSESINDTNDGSPSGTPIANTVYSAVAFTLGFQAAGANTCTITGSINGVPQDFGTTLTNISPSYRWTNVSVTNTGSAPLVYKWTADCVSAAGKHGYASTTLTILPAPPVATGNFYFDGNAVPNNGVVPIRQSSGHIFSFSASNVTTCSVNRTSYRWNILYGRMGPAQDAGYPMNFPNGSYSWSIAQYLKSWNSYIKWPALQKPDGTYVDQDYFYTLTCSRPNTDLKFSTAFNLKVTP